MTINEMVQETLQAGITPLQLAFDGVRYFDSHKVIVRSTLLIYSLDMGILTPREYRYVARRRKKGDDMTERHLRKLLEHCSALLEETPAIECITFPAYPQTLMTGALAAMLFEAFTEHPEVPPSKICVELSADLLYEDTKLAREQIDRLRELGVKVAIFELGDEYCPVFRLGELKFDYAFADGFSADLLAREEGEAATILPKMVHMFGARIFAPELGGEAEINKAKKAEYDGYGVVAPEVPEPIEDEEAPPEEVQEPPEAQEPPPTQPEEPDEVLIEPPEAAPPEEESATDPPGKEAEQ